MKSYNKNHEFEHFFLDWNKNVSYMIWGTSRTADYFMRQKGTELICDCFLDSDSKKWGTMFYGKPVCSPDDGMRRFPGSKIIVASQAYTKPL